MRRDLEKYLIVLQKQCNEMNKALEEATELAQEGKLTAEQIENINSQAAIISNNYQRVLYCRYLLMMPPKFIQKIRSKKLNKQAAEFVKEQADKEAVEKENAESLDKIKEEVSNE